jgi:PAS domain S-box-containing protein
MDLISGLFGRGSYLPHGYCFTWTPSLLWSMVLADGLIAAAYFSIPVAILTFVRRRRAPSGNWIPWLFCAFIFACGTTHVMDVWTIWQADYALQAASKVLTAGISIVAAAALWFLIPTALRIPSVEGLQLAVSSLEAEVRRRRSVEDSLVEAEQNLAVTLASIGAGFVSTDRDGRVTRLNEVGERVLGWPQGMALGKPFWTVFAREERDPELTTRNPIDVMVQAGITVDVAHDVQVMSRAGTKTPVQVKAALTYAEDGAPRGLAVVFRDMSREILAAQDASRLARIVESSFDAIIGKNLDGIITSWNPGAERLFGYAPGEAIGQPMRMLIPDERASEEPEILAHIARGERVEHFETVRRRKDGTLIHVSASISPVRDAAGRVIGASKIARDITERKEADARLLAQLQRLRLLDQLTHAIGERQDLLSIYQVAVRSLGEQLPADFSCVLDHDATRGQLVMTSFGVPSDIAGLPTGTTVDVDRNGLSPCVDGELVYQPDARGSACPFAKLLAEAGLNSFIVAPLRPEGRLLGVLLAARGAPEAFSSGECEFVRQLSSHVALAAHQAQLHEKLQAAFDELRQTQQAAMQQERLRALGQMASGIAHDINNALSPAVLYAEMLLEREALSERARGHVQVIARAVDDVAATVARMREFYRARGTQIELLPVALNDLVGQVIDLSRARWSDMPQQRGVFIDLSISLQEHLPPVWGIESEIRELLVNLVFNAVDAMPGGGTLTLRTLHVAPSEDGDGDPDAPARVAVEVCDTGIGMDENTRRHCLEPFFTTKGERGTGLGLAMVYGVAKRHGADIGIRSAPGAGTRMRVIFPARPPMAAEAAQRAAHASERLRLLIVDDDPTLLRSLGEILAAEGHDVTPASGGQAGIDAFDAAAGSADAFDVVITDLGMPHVDGRAMAAAVKQRSPATPVILLTGWGQQMDEDGEVPPGVDVVLSKPPRLASLRDGLARCRSRGMADD